MASHVRDRSMVDVYHVTVLGALPQETARRIAAVHALAIILGSSHGECNVPPSPAIGGEVEHPKNSAPAESMGQIDDGRPPQLP